jgi:hypothetical protein
MSGLLVPLSCRRYQAPSSTVSQLLAAWAHSDVARVDAALVERLALQASPHALQHQVGRVGILMRVSALL